MQEQSRRIPAQKIRKHLLRLSGSPLHIDRLENSDGIFEQELGVIRSALSREEGEDLQLATDKGPRAGDESRVGGEVARERAGAVAR